MAEIPDALIEQATKAAAESYNSTPETLARVVLMAVAPAIAAQAVRDAADALDTDGREVAADHHPGAQIAANVTFMDAAFLRERADQIEEEDR